MKEVGCLLQQNVRTQSSPTRRTTDVNTEAQVCELSLIIL